jgi:hypothetical protein
MNDKPHGFEVLQEEDRPAWRKVIFVALAALAIISVLVIAAWASRGLREAELRPGLDFPEQRLGPRHDVQEVHQDVFVDRGFGQLLEAQKRKELSSYGWVDKDRRLVRIPVDQAKDLVVEENRR